MKKWLAVILSALLLLGAFAVAETASEDDGDLNEFNDGYEGNWVQVDALGFEFCLPDGWSETLPAADAAFAAASETGATLNIRAVAEGVSSLSAWGASNLKDAKHYEANFYDVLAEESDNALSAYLIISDGRVLAFDFSRNGKDALPTPFALQILGSACVLWDDDDVPLMDGDEDADFGAAFEADLG